MKRKNTTPKKDTPRPSQEGREHILLGEQEPGTARLDQLKNKEMITTNHHNQEPETTDIDHLRNKEMILKNHDDQNASAMSMDQLKNKEMIVFVVGGLLVLALIWAAISFGNGGFSSGPIIVDDDDDDHISTPMPDEAAAPLEGCFTNGSETICDIPEFQTCEQDVSVSRRDRLILNWGNFAGNEIEIQEMDDIVLNVAVQRNADDGTVVIEDVILWGMESQTGCLAEGYYGGKGDAEPDPEKAIDILVSPTDDGFDCFFPENSTDIISCEISVTEDFVTMDICDPESNPVGTGLDTLLASPKNVQTELDTFESFRSLGGGIHENCYTPVGNGPTENAPTLLLEKSEDHTPKVCYAIPQSDGTSKVVCEEKVEAPLVRLPACEVEGSVVPELDISIFWVDPEHIIDSFFDLNYGAGLEGDPNLDGEFNAEDFIVFLNPSAGTGCFAPRGDKSHQGWSDLSSLASGLGATGDGHKDWIQILLSVPAETRDAELFLFTDADANPDGCFASSYYGGTKFTCEPSLVDIPEPMTTCQADDDTSSNMQIFPDWDGIDRLIQNDPNVDPNLPLPIVLAWSQPDGSNQPTGLVATFDHENRTGCFQSTYYGGKKEAVNIDLLIDSDPETGEVACNPIASDGSEVECSGTWENGGLSCVPQNDGSLFCTFDGETAGVGILCTQDDTGEWLCKPTEYGNQNNNEPSKKDSDNKDDDDDASSPQPTQQPPPRPTETPDPTGG
ncbi:MAG: hypothetical protein GY755_10740 [Chloroflexi bacterium]|nr:hypothetical protein [Chloroflexota bacterium]